MVARLGFRGKRRMPPFLSSISTRPKAPYDTLAFLYYAPGKEPTGDLSKGVVFCSSQLHERLIDNDKIVFRKSSLQF
jgi:hypothetical protein